jgi:hypothetical protein
MEASQCSILDKIPCVSGVFQVSIISMSQKRAGIFIDMTQTPEKSNIEVRGE